MRLHKLDNGKFWMVALVVLGHVLERRMHDFAIARSLYQAIYLVHVPVLVTLSGMTFRSNETEELLRKGLKSLGVPLVLFTMLYELPHVVILGSLSKYSRKFSPYWLLWFLVSLLCWRLMANHVSRLKWPLPYTIVVFIMLAVGAGGVDSIGYPFSLSRTIVFFPFFLLGMELQKRNVLHLRMPAFYRWSAGLIVLSMLIISYRYPSLVSLNILYGVKSYAAQGLSLGAGGLTRALWYIYAVLLVLSVLTLLPTNASRWTKLGAQSMSIYLLHGYGVKFLEYANILDVLSPRLSGSTFVAFALIYTALLVFLTTREPVEQGFQKVISIISSILPESGK